MLLAGSAHIIKALTRPIRHTNTATNSSLIKLARLDWTGRGGQDPFARPLKGRHSVTQLVPLTLMYTTRRQQFSLGSFVSERGRQEHWTNAELGPAPNKRPSDLYEFFRCRRHSPPTRRRQRRPFAPCNNLNYFFLVLLSLQPVDRTRG